MSSKCLWI